MQAHADFEMVRDYDNFFSIRPHINNFCPPHFHSNVEIVYVVGGKIEVTINGQTKLLTRGWASIANSYDVHTYTTIGDSDTRILIIPVNMIGQFERLMKSKSFCSPFLMPGVHNPELEAAIDRVEAYSNTEGSLVSAGYLYVLLGLFFDNLELSNTERDTGTTSLIRHMLIFLEHHYLEPLSLDDLAKQCGYNKCYISRIFNATLGCGFNRYLNYLRVRHAAKLIRNSTDSFDEISYSSGFQGVRNLNRYFQMFYQTTPKEYRRQR